MQYIVFYPAAKVLGSGGLCNEFLMALAKRMEDHKMKLLERFCMTYIRTEVPTWYYKVWLSLKTVALFKTAEKTDVRPIGLRNSLVKVIHREVMRKFKNEICHHLEPVQLGMSMAGAAKLVLSPGGTIRANREHICIK